MRNLSVRTKITLWFSAAMLVIVVVTYISVISVSNRVLQKTIRDNLIETVENNVDEVEYYSSLDGFDLEDDVDHFVAYGSGYIEVDDDFLDEVNQVYTSLCDTSGYLVYGENPIADNTNGIEFTDSTIQTVKVDGIIYYIFDRNLSQQGLDDLWLRGVVSETQGAAQIESITRTSLIILPLIVIITIIGGYLLAERMLRPVRDITRTAGDIRQGEDLSKRIDVGEGKDELHELAQSFNDMFERLEDTFKKERQFTSDASHELRTPMSVIMAQCELTLEEERTVPEYEEALTVIQRQGGKMTRLINDMLDFTRLELKSEKYAKSEIDLSELVRSVCEDMSLVREKNITLMCRVQDNVYVYGNRELLQRIIVNLISNAYRYGKENGHIEVRLWRGGDEPFENGANVFSGSVLARDEKSVYLTVADDGIGIAEDDIGKIFDRFYQSDSARSGSGTGLGLSLAQEMAHFHGGAITVESRQGTGSRFIVQL